MDDKVVSVAVFEAKDGCRCHDGGPFGAVIIDEDDNIICSAHNMVLKNNDPTAHAEVTAIRKACKILNTHDLSGYRIISSCEPCPMCLAAIIWANIDTVYYGATRIHAQNAGFKDKDIYDFLSGKNDILEKKHIKSEECINVLKNYKGEIY